ncbi:hypothetical protein [Streptococcus equi]|nr:hypothetical protein [Streptococcus equi]
MDKRQWIVGKNKVVLKFGTAERFFLQAEEAIRDVAPSRGVGDVYKGQA